VSGLLDKAGNDEQVKENARYRSAAALLRRSQLNTFVRSIPAAPGHHTRRNGSEDTSNCGGRQGSTDRRMNDHTQYARRKHHPLFNVAVNTLTQLHTSSSARVRRYSQAREEEMREKEEQR
jgi:hypothetical protein